METFTFADVAIAIPERVTGPHRKVWAKLAGPGSWWTGAERVAIADESRRALDCAFCAERREALSAGAVEGEHDSGGVLPAVAVEAVHKIVTDSARLSLAWYEGLVADGLSDAHYSELVGLLVAVFSIDEFHRGIGAALEPLPEAEPGEPERRRPSGATMEGAWLATVPADALDPEDADIYGGGRHAPNVVRALSLVPENVRTLGDLHGAHYLSYDEMRIMEKIRDLSRSQMELVAARTSAVNECFY
jgi:hypothetical protein